MPIFSRRKKGSGSDMGSSRKQKSGVSKIKTVEKTTVTTTTTVTKRPSKTLLNDAELKKKYKIDQQTLVQYRAVFNDFDKNNTGYITAEDLGSVLRSLGQNPSKTELADIIQEWDLDGNNRLDFDEFIHMMVKRSEMNDGEEDLKHVFKLFDSNNDGSLSQAEIKQAIKKLDASISNADMERIIKEADTNQDGKIDFNEFKNIIDRL